MQTTAIRRSAAPVALAAALLAAFLVLFSPVSASAHDALVSSSPEADATIDTLPGEITLTFSAELITGEGATEMVVTAADGTSVTDGAAVTAGSVVTQPLVAEAAAGTYHVVWKVVSSDGHPTSGEYFFSVTNSTVSTPTAEPNASESAAPTGAPLDEIAPSPTTTATEAPAVSSPSGLVWLFTILGIVVFVGGLGVAVWLLVRSRRKAGGADSDSSSER